MTERVIGAVLRARADRAANERFIRCGGGWLSNADVLGRAERTAAGLAALGVATGDRVAIICPNREEIIDLIFGCAVLGAIQVPLNAYLKGEFLRYQMVDSGASVLIADPAGWRNAVPVLDKTGIKRGVILDVPADDPDEPRLWDYVGYSEMMANRTVDRLHADVEPGGIASILYTSGTTGMPKGCVLSQGYYTHVARPLRDAGLVLPGDLVFTSMPLFHGGAQLMALMSAMGNDAAVHFEERFSASTFMAHARAAQASTLWGTGSMATMILAQPPTDEDASYAFRFAHLPPLHPDKQVEFETRFNCPVVAAGYGQTECTPALVSPSISGGRRTSAGVPTKYLDVRLVDDEDREVPAGQVGEIVIRPREPHVMYDRYWGGADCGSGFTDGWHHTGDCGRIEEDGEFTFIDRKKDSIRRRGENVSSYELEQALLQYPGITSAAVFAVPSHLGEDEIAALVVPAGDAEFDPAVLFAFLRDRVPYYAIPRYVDVRVSLPVNAMGRVMKQQLRESGVPRGAYDFEALGLVVSVEGRRG